MARKILRLFLTVCMVTGLLAAMQTAAGAATEGIYTYEISNGKATITECDSFASGDITIPSTLGGCSVTAIGDYAFCRCYSLISISIPDSVTSIGDYAFYRCYSLT
ncbi:MAG: leucine-rich repeat protein, partial [Clostridia bacterium]|nr:leucine-rich repeat protein [Clostridia bacterium]